MYSSPSFNSQSSTPAVPTVYSHPLPLFSCIIFKQTQDIISPTNICVYISKSEGFFLFLYNQNLKKNWKFDNPLNNMK